MYKTYCKSGLQSNPALQTPHYHGQFSLSLGKPLYFLQIQPA